MKVYRAISQEEKRTANEMYMCGERNMCKRHNIKRCQVQKMKTDDILRLQLQEIIEGEEERSAFLFSLMQILEKGFHDLNNALQNSISQVFNIVYPCCIII